MNGKSRLCVLCAAIASVNGVYALDSDRLAEDVVAETDFRVVNRLQDLPADAERALSAIMSGHTLANFGEPFHHSQWDRTSELPAGQHLFSAVSDKVFVIAWRQFTPALVYSVVASYRDSDEVCHYITSKGAMPSVITYTQKYIATAECTVRNVYDPFGSNASTR